MNRIFVILVLLRLFVAASSAGADEPPFSDEARVHLERGLRQYEAKRFEAAIAEFRAGYAKDPRREFLYAWAQAERLSGDCPSAIVLYRRFLAASPPPRQARAAQENLARCESALSTTPGLVAAPSGPIPSAATSSPPPAVRATASSARTGAQPDLTPSTSSPSRPLAPPRQPRSWHEDRLGHALAAGGGGLVVVGGLFYWFSLRSEAAAGEASTYDEFAARLEQANDRRRIASIGAAAGAGLLAAAAVRYYLVGRGSREPAPVPSRLTLWYDGRHALLSFAGEF